MVGEMEFKVGRWLHMKPESMWIEVIKNEKALPLLKEHSIKVKSKILNNSTTDFAFAYDKKGGKLGGILVLPKDDDDMVIKVLDKKILTGRLQNALIVNLYC